MRRLHACAQQLSRVLGCIARRIEEDVAWLDCLVYGRIGVFSGNLDEGQCREKKTEWWLRWSLVTLGPVWRR